MSLLARLSSFQHDPSGQVANFSDGLTASFSPAADGGALGDVLNIISSQALDALGAVQIPLACRWALGVMQLWQRVPACALPRKGGTASS